MATNPNGKESYSDHSKFLVQDPHFFKVVTFHPNHGLKVPDAFMRNYGWDLQHIVFLKIPTGASWQVELIHYGNGTFLQKGWEEFANYYSIKKFYFLVFIYRGNSKFLVLIFDPSALEIEYPVKINSCINGTSGQRGTSCVSTKLKVSDDDKEFEEISAEILKGINYGKIPASVEDINEENEVSVEILDDLSPCMPRSSHKLIMTEISSKDVVNAEQDGNPGCSKEKLNKEKSSVGTRRALRSSTSISISKSNYKTLTPKEKFKSYEKAKDFTSSKPFFISVMQPSHLSYKLEMPKKFLSDYISKKKRELFKLHVSGRIKSWPATVTIHPDGLRGVRASLTGGWKNFVQDNGLQVGDVCVFELFLLRTRKFNVTIYRQAEDVNAS